MDNLNDMEQRNLVDELKQGRELAKQLKNQIGPVSSKETCQHIIQKILSSYDKALACLNWSELLQKCPLPTVDESPRVVFKKRKTLPRWRQEVKVCSGTGLEGPIDDGHSWRKYGQKDILGATNPRAYYRCTHKHTRGCLATKQVQKTEKDPLIFEVTYRGKHTCMNAPNSPPSLEENHKDIINHLHQQPQPKQKQNQKIPFEFGQGLKLETEEMNPKTVGRIPSFSFPSTSIQSQNDDIWEQFDENNMLVRSISPETSASNYFSDLTDMISTPTSCNTTSLFDFNMDSVEVNNIQPNLSLDDLDYFTAIV